MSAIKLWGVSFNGERAVLGKGWLRNPVVSRYDGEPFEPLLFMTRRQAQAWTRERNAFYAAYPRGHVCREWKFTVRRVTRIIKVMP